MMSKPYDTSPTLDIQFDDDCSGFALEALDI